MGDLSFVARLGWRRWQLERSCGWSREALRVHQENSLREIRQFAYSHSPFYRRFHKGLESAPLAELPVLSKRVLMENFDDVVTDSAVRLSDVEAFLAGNPSARLFLDRYVALATSGSTGLRGVFLFDPDEWLTAMASISRPMAWGGVRPNPFRPKRSAMIASTANWHYSARVGLSFPKRFFPSLRLDAAEPVGSMMKRLNEWQPEVLMAYPSALRELAHEQLAGRLRLHLQRAASSAEVLTDETRELARQAWGVRVYDTYGATEYAPIAAECSHGRRHLFEDGAVIETDGDRLLLTVFNRHTMPLIRYEISDMVHLSDERCECGRPFRVIDRIEGRAEDVLEFGGIRVHPNVFHAVLEHAPVSGWQVIQGDGELRVNLTGVGNGTVCAEVERKVVALLPGTRVFVRPVTELQRGASGKAPLILARKAKA